MENENELTFAKSNIQEKSNSLELTPIKRENPRKKYRHDYLNHYPEYKDKVNNITKKEVIFVDVTNWTKASGSFLKPEDVKKIPSGIFIITDEGSFVKSEKFGTDQFHLGGEFAGQEKTFTCSKTNARAIEKVLGTDSKKWIGHQLTFELYKTKTSDGKLVDALNVKEVK